MVVIAILAAVVLAPLVREYGDLRRSCGLSRLGALGTTGLVLPAFGVATVLALPLGAHPAAQWLTIVLTTLLIYSLAANALVSASATQAVSSQP